MKSETWWVIEAPNREFMSGTNALEEDAAWIPLTVHHYRRVDRMRARKRFEANGYRAVKIKIVRVK